MKHVPAPESLTLNIINEFDIPMVDGVDPDTGKPKPATMEYWKFLIGRTFDEAFVEHGGKKTGIDLQELLDLARLQIKENCASGRPFHTFDDEVAKRLRQAILHPKEGRLGPLQLEHNWLRWSSIWKPEPLSQLPAVLATQEAAPQLAAPSQEDTVAP